MNAGIKPPDIYITEAGDNLGIGVFAVRSFSQNEIVEVAPVFLIEENYSSLPKEFQTRVFNWGYLTRSHIKNAIALGYGSIYNHSDHPNLFYEADAKNKVIKFIAKRDIESNEQLTIHYNQNDDASLPDKATWFEKKGIEKINN